MKRIGIVGWKTGDNSFGATVPYLSFFSQFGVVEVIMPNETKVRELDLLVLPGGPDVDPMRYLTEDDALSFDMGKPCPFRERFDMVLLPKYIEQRIPIFGICRGHQSLSVYFGGSLVQHMGHETNLSHDRAAGVHKLNFVTENDFVSELLERIKFKGNKINYLVNSIHHQSVDINPDNSIVIANYSPLKGAFESDEIEVLGYTNYPAYTVQYHPEENYDELATKLIEDLLDNQSTLVQLVAEVEELEYIEHVNTNL